MRKNSLMELSLHVWRNTKGSQKTTRNISNYSGTLVKYRDRAIFFSRHLVVNVGHRALSSFFIVFDTVPPASNLFGNVIYHQSSLLKDVLFFGTPHLLVVIPISTSISVIHHLKVSDYLFPE